MTPANRDALLAVGIVLLVGVFTILVCALWLRHVLMTPTPREYDREAQFPVIVGEPYDELADDDVPDIPAGQVAGNMVCECGRPKNPGDAYCLACYDEATFIPMSQVMHAPRGDEA